MIINGYTAEFMQGILDANINGGAINAAGHLMLTRQDGTQIDAGYFGLSAALINVATDFKTLTTPGTYYFSASAVVAASANAPSGSLYGFTAGQAGFLLVEGNGGTFVKQTWTNYNNPAETLIATRYNGTIWYGWFPPARMASQTASGIIEIATAAEITAGTDNARAVTPAGLAVGYRYLQTVVFTSSGTFTKASYPTARAIRIRAIGGGGAGATSQAASTGNHSGGGGGGGGGCADKFVLLSALAASETVTVGAGGNNTSGGNGYSGGTSSFGTQAVATGGEGGYTGDNTALAITGVGGNGGIGTSGDILTAGDTGGNGGGYATLGTGGAGGGSAMGGGGQSVYNGGGSARTAGNPGRAYGGGGGGSQTNAGSSSAISGGVGAAGIVIVEVYA